MGTYVREKSPPDKEEPKREADAPDAEDRPSSGDLLGDSALSTYLKRQTREAVKLVT
jgi:hypothetical protein